ncbi:hypothetical protein [Hafnia alvei]|uniref:hypothetical protein n=1 Tax=Hafnia alvei TaxID=569 RepID=UPI00345D6658
MSMSIIGNGPSINETQLHAMLTGNVNNATKLDGWDAFINFFIKLLNHLPGVSLEDKEASLRNIYNKIYSTENATVSGENTKLFEPIWLALDKLIHLMQKDKAQTMTFDIQCPNDADGMQYNHQSGEIRLNITIDGCQLADISCTHTNLNNDMLYSILTNYMLPKMDDRKGALSGVYQFNPNILGIEENDVYFDPVAKAANSHGFNIVKEIDKCRSFLDKNLHKCVVTETNFTDEAEQIERNQRLISTLQTLKMDENTATTSYNVLIDDTINELNNRLMTQQALYKEINAEFVDSLVQKWTLKLDQNQPLLKAEINEDITTITMIDPRALDLFTEADRDRLSQLPEQLKVVSQIADLKSQTSSPTEFTQKYFPALTSILIGTGSGPLTKTLMTHGQKIIEHKTDTEDQENINKRQLQALTKKMDNLITQVKTLPMTSPDSDTQQTPAISNNTSGQAIPAITSQLALFKNEINQQNLPQENKVSLSNKIDNLIVQHEKMKIIENKLNNYEIQNTRATNKDLRDINLEKDSVMPCKRRSDIEQRITALIIKNIQFDEISADLIGVKYSIASVNKNLAVYSPTFESRLARIEVRANALQLAEAEKKPLLTNIASTKEELLKLQQRDAVYTRVRTLLEQKTSSAALSGENWRTVLSQLRLVIIDLKKLPASPRKLELAKQFSEDVNAALTLLEQFIKGSPTGQEKARYMADREKDYILLRDLVRSNKLPNNAQLEEKITKIKHENKFKSTPFMQKFLK